MAKVKQGRNNNLDPFEVLENAGLSDDQLEKVKLAKQLRDDPMAVFENIPNLSDDQKKQLKLVVQLKTDPIAAIE